MNHDTNTMNGTISQFQVVHAAFCDIKQKINMKAEYGVVFDICHCTSYICRCYPLLTRDGLQILKLIL
jgi:hypothetical protein